MLLLNIPLFDNLYWYWYSSNFQNFSGVRPSSKFSNGDITKPTGDDMKIQRGELINILIWLKNRYTWFNQKHINGWVTFKCISYQNILKGLESNPIYQWVMQLSNAVTNQIYPKKPQYISLDRIFDIMYKTKISLSPGLVYPLSYVIRSEQICKTINISWHLVSLYITAD